MQRNLKKNSGLVTRHTELCNPELKYYLFLFRTKVLNSKIELGKPIVCILVLTKLRTEQSRNNGSIPYSGSIYFYYLQLPDCLWDKLQSIQAYG
jgi:hypothetical protein